MLKAQDCLEALPEQGTPFQALPGSQPLPESPLRGLKSWARLAWKPSIPFAQFPSPLGLLPGSWSWQHQGRGQAGCPLRAQPSQDFWGEGGSFSPTTPPSCLDRPALLSAFSSPFHFPPLCPSPPPLSHSFYFRENPKLKAAEAGMSGTHTHFHVWSQS